MTARDTLAEAIDGSRMDGRIFQVVRVCFVYSRGIISRVQRRNRYVVCRVQARLMVQSLGYLNYFLPS